MGLNLLHELPISQLMGRVGQLVNFRFSINYVDIFLRYSCVKIGDCVILSVPKSSNEGVDTLWVYLFDILHDVGFDIVCFFHDFLFDGLEKFLRLHQQGSLYAQMFPDVVFGELVQRQGSHCHPDNLVAVVADAADQFHVAIMQVVLAHVVVIQAA